MKNLVNYKKVYECLDNECKFIIDQEISTSEHDTKEMPLTRKTIQLKDFSPVGDDEIEGYVSTRDMDWSKDVVLPEGIILDVFQKNPTFLFNHDTTKVIGKAVSLIVDEYGVKARIQFAPTNEAQDFLKLVKGSFINTFSIGFIPVNFYKRKDRQFKSLNDSLMQKYPEYTGDAERIITKWVLLEVSIVATPDNPNAIITQKQINEMEIKSSTLDMLNLKCSDCEAATAEFIKELNDRKIITQKIINLSNEEKSMYWKAFDNKRIKFEKSLKDEVSNIFKSEAKKIGDVGGDVSDIYTKVSAIIDKDKPKIKAILKAFYISVVEEFGEQVFEDLIAEETEKKEIKQIDEDSDFDITPAALLFITGKVAESSLSITNTSKERVKLVIDKGIASDKTMDEIKSDINEMYEDSFVENRSDLISATEVVIASNFASILAAEQTGVDLKKIWLPVYDNKTRDTHAQAGSHPAIDIDDYFIVGGSEMLYPADPNGPVEEVINCRCALGYETVDNSKSITINREIKVIKKPVSDKDILDKKIQLLEKKKALLLEVQERKNKQEECKRLESILTKKGKLVRY